MILQSSNIYTQKRSERTVQRMGCKIISWFSKFGDLQNYEDVTKRSDRVSLNRVHFKKYLWFTLTLTHFRFYIGHIYWIFWKCKKYEDVVKRSDRVGWHNLLALEKSLRGAVCSQFVSAGKCFCSPAFSSVFFLPIYLFSGEKDNFALKIPLCTLFAFILEEFLSSCPLIFFIFFQYFVLVFLYSICVIVFFLSF